MDYKLIFVKKIGFNYKGHSTYDFIFCEEDYDLEDVWGDGWEEIPAEGYAQPPHLDNIAKAGSLQVKDYELDVAHDSLHFGMCDAKDNVIALAWEVIDENFQPGDERLVFRFGESIRSIEEKLKKRNLKLVYEKD